MPPRKAKVCCFSFAGFRVSGYGVQACRIRSIPKGSLAYIRVLQVPMRSTRGLWFRCLGFGEVACMWLSRPPNAEKHLQVSGP